MRELQIKSFMVNGNIPNVWATFSNRNMDCINVKFLLKVPQFANMTLLIEACIVYFNFWF